jgi:hypothetical protein
MSDASKEATRVVLERISRAIEAHPDADERTIRKRAGMTRRSGNEALALLLRAGLIRRELVDAEWRYRSVKPYRAAAFAPKPDFSSSHSTGMGGGG